MEELPHFPLSTWPVSKRNPGNWLPPVDRSGSWPSSSRWTPCSSFDFEVVPTCLDLEKKVKKRYKFLLLESRHATKNIRLNTWNIVWNWVCFVHLPHCTRPGNLAVIHQQLGTFKAPRSLIVVVDRALADNTLLGVPPSVAIHLHPDQLDSIAQANRPMGGKSSPLLPSTFFVPR